MHGFPEAYTVSNLKELLDANQYVPDYIGDDEVERLVDTAEQRADSRGEPLEDDEQDCLIITDWSSFATDEFGFDGDSMNQVAIGRLNWDVSSGKDATLFENTVVVQDTWLISGDGRKTQIKQYVDEDWGKASDGDMWVPNGAAEYIAIVALDSQLVHDRPQAAEAM